MAVWNMPNDMENSNSNGDLGDGLECLGFLTKRKSIRLFITIMKRTNLQSCTELTAHVVHDLDIGSISTGIQYLLEAAKPVLISKKSKVSKSRRRLSVN